jgi:hypothetical protein
MNKSTQSLVTADCLGGELFFGEVDGGPLLR